MNKDEVEYRIGELTHLLSAVKTYMRKGGSFLLNRIAPNGPIMREKNLDYVHKASWGLYASGADRTVLLRIMDWVEDKALQPNGDLYFPEEPPEYRVMQRAYRPLNILKVAAWIKHGIAENKLIIDRILQYQHASGGVFNYIGDNPDRVEEQEWIGPLDTSFFGHLMIALDRRKEAVKAGEWIERFVRENEKHMKKGLMYTQMKPKGGLITDVKPGEKASKTLNNKDPKQYFWQVGTCMAYLCALYDAMRGSWGYGEADCKRFLEASLTLLRFEETMPIYTYFWPSKCKVGWGAGELIKVLVKYGGSIDLIERASRVAEKVAVHTFIENQLPNGGHSCMHYPLTEDAAELRFDYRPLYGLVNVPDTPIPGSKTIWLPAEEITGEFLGEMSSIETGLKLQLEHYRRMMET